MMFATPTAPTSSATAPSPRNRPLKRALRVGARGERGRGLADVDFVGRFRVGGRGEHRLDGRDLAVLGAQVDGVGVPVEVQVAFRGLEADEHRAFDFGRRAPMGRGSRRGRTTGSRPRSARRGRCGRSRVAARRRSRAPRPAPWRWRRSGSGPARPATPSVCSRPRLAAWTLRALVSTVGISGDAVHLAFDLPGLGDGFDRVDARDHRRRHERQLGGLAGEALAVGDRQQVRAEPVDLFAAAPPGSRRTGRAPPRSRRPRSRSRAPRARPAAAACAAPRSRRARDRRPAASAGRGPRRRQLGSVGARSSLLPGCFVDERERRRPARARRSP